MSRPSEVAIVALPTTAVHAMQSNSLWSYFYGITTPEQYVASLTSPGKKHGGACGAAASDVVVTPESAFRLARLAMRASALYDRIVEYHPPRSNLRDFCRYLLVFHYLLEGKLAQRGDCVPPEATAAAPGASSNSAPPMPADEAVSWTTNTQNPSNTFHHSANGPLHPPPGLQPAQASTTPIHGVPESVLLLPSPSHTAMMLGALRAVSEVQGLVRRVFRALVAASSEGASGSTVSAPAVRFPVFRSFLRSVVTVIGGYALEALGGGAGAPAELWLTEMDEITDAHIVDAVVRGEWWRLRAGASGLLLGDFSTWLMSTLVLFTASDRHGDGSVAECITLLSKVFLPLAEKLGASSSVGQGTTTALQLVAGNDAGARTDGKVDDHNATRSPRNTHKITTQPRKSDPHRATDRHCRSSPQRRGNDAVSAVIPQFASLRPGRGVDPADGAKGVSQVQPELVESVAALLSHRKNKPDDDLTAQLLHRGAVRLLDGYPVRLTKPQALPHPFVSEGTGGTPTRSTAT